MKLSLQRCLSNHSSFQVIDELLKFLIYQHQLTPSPVASLLHEESERREIDKKQKDNRVETAVMVRSYADVKKNQQINKCDTFVNEFLSVRDCLRNVFRSVNNGLIKEVLIGFGGNSLRIKFAYRILLAHCSKDPPCQLEALSNKELMSLVRCFFTGDFSERDWKNLAGMKVFLFLRVGAEATMPSCELKETFNPDGIGETLYIRVSHRSCDSADEIAETFDAVQIDSNTSSPMWYLCAAPISGLKL